MNERLRSESWAQHAADSSRFGRRTPEAQVDIAAARAPSCAHAIYQPDCPSCATDLATAEAEREARAAAQGARQAAAIEAGRPIGGPLSSETVDLDAALSNAAIADTPAVREMGGLKIEGVVRGSIRAWRRPGGNVGIDTTHVGSLVRDTGTGPHVVIERADLDDAIAALQALAGTPPPGEVTPVLPPDAIVLTGAEAERYRAIVAMARKAQASAGAARADGAALLQLFQAFCAGLAPGKES